MRSRFAVLAGLLSVPYAHADLQAKPHTGVAGIDFESQLGYDIGYDDNVTGSATTKIKSVPATRILNLSSKPSANVMKTATC